MRTKNLFLTFLFLLLPLTLAAQYNLAVSKVLDGRYRKNRHTTDIEITSERLVAYHLDYYHSLTVTDDAAIMDALAAAVLADEPQAIEKEFSMVGDRLFYGFFQMKDEFPFTSSNHPLVHRYIFFRDMRLSPDAPSATVTLIYMEGVATLDFLKRKFSK